MKFLEPEMFWHLAWILPAMLAIFISAWYRREKVLSVLTGNKKPDNITVFCSPGMRIFRFILLILTVIFLITALARPAWDYQTIDMTGSGRDLLVVFDTSKSMLSRDVQPSRLEHAKWVIKELVKLNPGDRFGLVSFAGKAFLECPMTVDRTSFLQHVSELDAATIPVGGTNIEKALTTALKSFEAAETLHQAIILVTDGDELTGNSDDVIDKLIEKKIPLFIIGLGDPSQPPIIQYRDEKGIERILKDSAGNTVNSPLNEKHLIELARKTGGIYVRSTATDTGLNAIENRIRKLDASEYTTTTMQKPIERFVYPLWAALVALLLWMCLSERGKEKKALLILFFLGITTIVSAQTENPAPTAEELFNSGVQIQTGKVIPKQPEDGSTVDPLAVAEDFYLKALAAAPDKKLAEKIYQNLGAIHQAKGQNLIQKATESLEAQNVQDALKGLDAVLEQLNIAEKYYQESLISADNNRGVVRNQSKLLKLRKDSMELKKKLEDFLKKQQEAQRQIQNARDQQQKDNKDQKNQNDQDNKDQKNQNDQDNKDQKNQNDQDNKDQKNQNDQDNKDQNDQNQNSQSQKPSAQNAISKAQQATDDMKNSAKDLGLKDKENQAAAAKNELDNAEQELKKNNPQKAQKHLDNAARIMGSPENNENKDQKDQKQKDQNDQNGQNNKDQKDQNDQNNKDNPDEKINQPQPKQPAQPQKQEKKEGEIDKNQAEAILSQMGDDEKALRDAIKNHRRKNSKLPPATKDW